MHKPDGSDIRFKISFMGAKVKHLFRSVGCAIGRFFVMLGRGILWLLSRIGGFFKGIPAWFSGWLKRFHDVPRGDKIKAIVFILVIVALVVVGILCVPYFQRLFSSDTRQEFVSEIQNAGPWGVITLLGLQILQVVVAFIPGEVVQIMAGMLYGAVGGWAICIVGAVLSSVVIFVLVNKLGMPFVERMVPKEQMRKFSFMQNSKRLDMIMFILFFIPGLPKDVLTYIAPVTKMPLKRFILISTLGRTPALIASTYGGAAWTKGNYLSMIIVFSVCGILGILGIVFSDKIVSWLSKEKGEIRSKYDRTLAASREKRALKEGINETRRRKLLAEGSSATTSATQDEDDAHRNSGRA